MKNIKKHICTYHILNNNGWPCILIRVVRCFEPLIHNFSQKVDQACFTNSCRKFLTVFCMLAKANFHVMRLICDTDMTSSRH